MPGGGDREADRVVDETPDRLGCVVLPLAALQ